MTSEKTFLLFHGWGISLYLYKKIIKESRKISKTDILTIPGLKVLAIFGRDDDIIPLPKSLNNVEFEVVERDHYFFLRKPELLMEKI